MPYTTGARTGQTNSAEDIYSIIAAQLTAHSNWAFVEDWTVGGTAKHSVWKCLGAANTVGVDFFVIFSRTTANSTDLNIGMAETYDAATHSYGRPAPTPSGSATSAAADGSFGGTTVYALSTTTTSITSMLRLPVIGSATAYDYWLAVNKDGFFIETKVSTAYYGVVVGSVDSLVMNPATNDPVPLAISTTNLAASTGVAYAATTRHPFAPASKSRMWGLEALTSYSPWPERALVGTVGAATPNGDLFQGGLVIGARQAARTWAFASDANSAVGQGALRGLWRNVLFINTATGVVIGDTVTVGGNLYVAFYSLGSGYMFYNTSAA